MPSSCAAVIPSACGAIAAERGSVVLNGSSLVTRNTGGGINAFGGAVTLNDDAAVTHNTSARGGGISIAGHLRQIGDFVQAVREDRPPSIDGHEGKRAVALVHAIYESAKAGTPVRL